MPASAVSDQENWLPDSSPPARKKVKKESSKSKDTDTSACRTVKSPKIKAKLSLLPTLPLDILFEIFGHLPPLDILHLARTTKGFRSTLMHRSAISIWKSSLRQITGLPDRPQDMSEPVWVNLVYSTHCHNCLVKKVLKVDWLLRIRLCQQCVKSSKLLRSNLHLDKEKKIDKRVLKCVPFSVYHIFGHNGPCCLVEDEQKFLKELQAAEADKSAFVQTRKDALVARKKHAADCEDWVDSLTQERWGELAGIRRKRSSDISDKLGELGFDEELDYLADMEGSSWILRQALVLFNDHPDVKVNKPLTERTWKTIEPRLVEYMQGVKAHRLAADRLDVVRHREKVAVSAWVQFRLQYPAERLLPSGIDILTWKEVKAIIELPSEVPTKEKDDAILTRDVQSSTGDATKKEPKPMVISPDSFTQIFESMTAFMSKWEDEKIHELGRLSPVGPRYFMWHHKTSDDMDRLRLATCIFSCEDLGKGPLSIHGSYKHFQDGQYPAMWFPEFLHHPCNTITSAVCDPKAAKVPENPLFRAPKEVGWCRRKEWSSDSLFFDEKASRVVKRLLEACGLNHEVVTTQEMDELDPRFICLKCSYGAKCDGQRPRKVMPWRNAVQHCMLVHWGDASVTWERITEESAVEARTLSAARSTGVGFKMWRCAHCRDSSGERDGKDTEDLMKEHLDDEHGIAEGVLCRDYYQAVDCPPLAVASVKMTPKEAAV
ncbi:hypothetical protein DFH06DRAFT_1207421 [Mycena polygramma]|nr:hypothetical protein DFH06DRAFT_1207421 [Mycena polygramma]